MKYIFKYNKLTNLIPFIFVYFLGQPVQIGESKSNKMTSHRYQVWQLNQLIAFLLSSLIIIRFTQRFFSLKCSQAWDGWCLLRVIVTLYKSPEVTLCPKPHLRVCVTSLKKWKWFMAGSLGDNLTKTDFLDPKIPGGMFMLGFFKTH